MIPCTDLVGRSDCGVQPATYCGVDNRRLGTATLQGLVVFDRLALHEIRNVRCLYSKL